VLTDLRNVLPYIEKYVVLIVLKFPYSKLKINGFMKQQRQQNSTNQKTLKFYTSLKIG